MEMKSLTKLIGTIAKTAKTHREQIQQAIVGCAFFAAVDRNTDPFDRLFEAVGPGVKKEGMLKWASLYAPVHFKEGKVLLSDKRQKELVLGCDDRAARIANFEESIKDAPEWYALAKEDPVANPWDSTKVAEKAAHFLEQTAMKADKNGDPILAERLRDAELLLRTLLSDAQYSVKTEAA